MSSAARIIYRRSFFAFFIALVAGCSAQHASLLPSASQTTTTQDRIISNTVRSGGKTYVVEEMYTPSTNSIQSITAGPDMHVWFSGGGEVGRSSMTGDMTTFAIPYYDATSIIEGIDHNLWVALDDPAAIGKFSSNGRLSPFPLPKKFGGTIGELFAIASEPSGHIWTLDEYENTYYLIGMTPEGTFSGYKLPEGSLPQDIAAASDGTLWLTDFSTNTIEHMTSPGAFKKFTVPSPNAGPTGLCLAADGTIWFVETDANKIGELTAADKFQEFSIPTPASKPSSIVVGPDGAIWFTETTAGKIGRVTTSGSFIELPLKSFYAEPYQITVGNDKNIWFTDYPNLLGRVELHQVKDSAPKYSSFTLSLEKSPQLGVAQNIPVRVQVKNLAGQILKGTYPYPVHLTTTDPEYAALSTHVLTSSSVKVNVKFTGHYTDATLGAYADGGGLVNSAIVLPSTPQEEKLTEPALSVAAGANNSVWMCLSDGKIAARSSNGSIQYYDATTGSTSEGCSIAEGSDGNMWFTDYWKNRIGKITPQGHVSFKQLDNDAWPFAITLGPDGALWFSESGLDKIGRLTTDGRLTAYDAQASPAYIIVGPDGNLWYDGGGLYKMTTSGVAKLVLNDYLVDELATANGSIWFDDASVLTEMSSAGKVEHKYNFPQTCIPYGMAGTPDGNLWYYDDVDACLGRLTPSGTLKTVPTFNQKVGNDAPFPGMIYGPGNNLWFAEPFNKGLGYLDPKTM